MKEKTTATFSLPTLEWMGQSIFRIVCFGGGVGLIRKAPGTWGTLVGWLLWLLISYFIRNEIIQASIIFIGFVFGLYAAQKVGEELGIHDYGGIVWDEIIAMWLVLFIISPLSLWWQLMAFVFFRVFDIVKPWPICFFDGHFKNGFGVMWDDIIAALYTLFVMAILVRLSIVLS